MVGALCGHSPVAVTILIVATQLHSFRNAHSLSPVYMQAVSRAEVDE